MVDFPREDGTIRYTPNDPVQSIQDETPNQVDVEKGREEFAKLQQKLTSHHDGPIEMSDLEIGQQSLMMPSEEFDIHKYFEESSRQDAKRGKKRKRMGVIGEGVTVVGQGFDASSIKDNLSPIRAGLKLLWPPNWFRKEKGTPFDIVHDVSFFCKDSEMLLVLGRPGAGCSTLLRVVANQRATYLSVDGDVTYGGLTSAEFSEYMGEAIYVPEEDMHYATLTVEDTLDFALKMKTPGQLLRDEKKKHFRETVIDALLNMFGLVKQRKTIAGDAFVRGLSGGERKRLTIAEAMVSQGSIDCWDCSTRGLDSASALDYAKSLRITTDTLRKTTLATFYQASESIFAQFDRVMVLEKGRCIYFGPTTEARGYFQSLGFTCESRKSTPDFVTGITNAQERQVMPGFEDKAPTNSIELEAAFKNSDNYKRALVEAQEYKKQIEEEHPANEFMEQVRANKRRGARKKSKYTANFLTQVFALTIRQYKIFFGNKFGIVTRYGSIIIQALIYGSVFYQLPLNASGGFTRGGALFAAILFNSFISIAEMAGTFLGRPILQKQKSYALYHPAAFHLAQVMLDVPVLLLQVTLWSVISYFMYGLDGSAHKFFVYLFVIFITAMCITQLFRLLGYASSSLYLSQQVLSALLILLLTYIGFTLPVQKMHPWLKWVYYINPISYAFRALYENEMRGIVFQCSATGYVPFGPTYTDPAYRTCLLSGSAPGQTIVTGEDFIANQYDFDADNVARDTLIVLAFWFGFTVLNCIVVEHKEYSKGGYSKKIFKRGKAPKQNDVEEERRLAEVTAKATSDLDKDLTIAGGVFMWKDIKYTVPVPEGKRLLLDNVEGWIKPGQMTALMGSSGAGKTTLLDVLAQRKTLGTVEGEMLLNGLPLAADFERITGYVEQMDVFNPYITVREALRFSAKLRQERSVPIKEKYDYVEKVLQMMEMQQLGDAIIGDLASGEGISVEERKRLTIGLELVAKPHIMFLDEPTSGLDSQSSYNIIKFIRKLANAGMPLVCTIHQPSPVLFEFFDRLLLLARGGKTVYFGDIGPKSTTLLKYFEDHGARHCEDSENPAEYILEAIGAGVNGKSNVDWTALWGEGADRKQVHIDLLDIEEKAKAGAKRTDVPMEFATSVGYQTLELYKRFNTVWWRSPAYNFGRVANAIAVGLIIGFSYWNLRYSSSDLQTRILAIFQILILGILLIVAALPQFSYLRDLFRRDYSSKFYSSLPFALALIFVDLPYVMVTGTVCVVCAYWSANLDSTPEHGFYFWLMFTLFFFFCTSFGQLIGALSPNVGIAMIVLPIFNTFLFLFAGVLAPPKTLPAFWYYWMYWIDPDHYFLEGVITDVFRDINITCDDRDFFRFNPPPGQTCGQYTADFISTATGYIDNPSATELCRYCLYNNGEEFYSQYDWHYSHRYINFVILAAFWIFNICVSGAAIYVFRKQRR